MRSELDLSYSVAPRYLEALGVERPLIIAVTGGIGSGKSAVTDRLSKHGVPVFDADEIARQVVAPGEIALAEIVAIFGPQALRRDGQLDRAALRALVFADDAARKQLNAIVHPRVHARLHTLAHAAGPAYVVLAIPLLVEAVHAYDWLDRTVVVDVPRAVQIERAMARDGMDRNVAERMLSAQATRARRLAVADDVITNDGPIAALDTIVPRLHARYRVLAKNRTSA